MTKTHEKEEQRTERILVGKKKKKEEEGGRCASRACAGCELLAGSMSPIVACSCSLWISQNKNPPTFTLYLYARHVHSIHLVLDVPPTYTTVYIHPVHCVPPELLLLLERGLGVDKEKRERGKKEKEKGHEKSDARTAQTRTHFRPSVRVSCHREFVVRAFSFPDSFHKKIFGSR